MRRASQPKAARPPANSASAGGSGTAITRSSATTKSPVIAFARVAPARCLVVALVCALGPVHDGTAVRSMNRVSRAGFRLARGAPRLMRLLYGALIGGLLRRYPPAVYSLLDATGCPADRAALADPGLRASLVATVREAFRAGSDGAANDLRACSRPWGYALSELAVPVGLWHGAADRTVPVAFATAYARALPHCETHIVAGEGHFSLPERHARPILSRLLDAGRP